MPQGLPKTPLINWNLPVLASTCNMQAIFFRYCWKNVFWGFRRRSQTEWLFVQVRATNLEPKSQHSARKDGFAGSIGHTSTRPQNNFFGPPESPKRDLKFVFCLTPLSQAEQKQCFQQQKTKKMLQKLGSIGHATQFWGSIGHASLIFNIGGRRWRAASVFDMYIERKRYIHILMLTRAFQCTRHGLREPLRRL